MRTKSPTSPRQGDERSMMASHDLEIIRLRIETNRLEVEAHLTLQQLSQHEAAMRSVVNDLKDGVVVPFSSDRRRPV